MGEVLFYRGMLLLIVLLLLAIVWKVVYPWVQALCMKVDKAGRDVVKETELVVSGKVHTPVIKDEKGGPVPAVEDDLFEVTKIADESRNKK